jgi:hypothetical protein
MFFFKSISLPQLSDEQNEQLNYSLKEYCFTEYLFWYLIIETNPKLEIDSILAKKMGIKPIKKSLSITTCATSSVSME